MRATTDITGSEVILFNDDTIWSPSVDILPNVNAASTTPAGTLTVVIDLGLYKYINGIIIHNGNPGITTFTLSRTNFVGNDDELIGDTAITDGQELKQSFSAKGAKILKFTVSFKQNGNSWSGLKHVKFLSPDDPEPFLLKHEDTSMYLSEGPNDKLLFNHYFTCRTYNYSLWTCSNGEIFNGKKTLKFMEKEDFDMIANKKNVESDEYTMLVPTFRDEATLRSSSIDFSGGVLAVTVNEVKYYLRPKNFPVHSFLRSGTYGDPNDAWHYVYKMKLESPGKYYLASCLKHFTWFFKTVLLVASILITLTDVTNISQLHFPGLLQGAVVLLISTMVTWPPLQTRKLMISYFHSPLALILGLGERNLKMENGVGLMELHGATQTGVLENQMDMEMNIFV